jgi:hypothetical protein
MREECEVEIEVQKKGGGCGGYSLNQYNFHRAFTVTVFKFFIGNPAFFLINSAVILAVSSVAFTSGIGVKTCSLPLAITYTGFPNASHPPPDSLQKQPNQLLTPVPISQSRSQVQ